MNIEYISDIPFLCYEHIEKKEDRKNIIIIHDAYEYINRYEEFAKFLFENNYNVYIIEYQGHGLLRKKEVSSFSNIDDSIINSINKVISKKLKNIKYSNVVIIGQGLGASISIQLAVKYGYFNLILSSLPIISNFNLKFNKLKSNIECLLSIKKTDIKINDINNLTKDKIELEKYLKDRECNFDVNPRYIYTYYDLVKKSMNDLNKIDKKANILLIFGSDDKNCENKDIRKYIGLLNNNTRNIKILKNRDGLKDNFHEVKRYNIFNEIIKFIEEMR